MALSLNGAESLLDDLESLPLAIYSLSKPASGFSGNCCRIRRSSDSTETDVGYAADGWVDLAAAEAFCGVGNGTIVTWYDGSGNAANATIGAGTAYLVESGVGVRRHGLPAIRLVGCSFDLSIASASTDHTWVIASEITGTPSTVKRVNAFDAETGRLIGLAFSTEADPDWSFFDGATRGVLGDNSNWLDSRAWRFSGAACTEFRDDREGATTAYTARSIGGNISIGGRYDHGAALANGWIRGWAAFDEAISDADLIRTSRMLRTGFGDRSTLSPTVTKNGAVVENGTGIRTGGVGSSSCVTSEASINYLFFAVNGGSSWDGITYATAPKADPHNWTQSDSIIVPTASGDYASIADGSAIKVGGDWYVFVSGRTSGKIGVSTGTDLGAMGSINEVIDQTASGLYHRHPSIVEEDGTYYLYTDTRIDQPAGEYGWVACHSSTDLSTWTDHGQMLTPGSAGFDAADIGAPSVRYNSTEARWEMLYSGYDGSGTPYPHEIGLAVADSPLGPWYPAEDNPIVPRGADTEFDDVQVHGPEWYLDGLYYTAAGQVGPYDALARATIEFSPSIVSVSVSSVTLVGDSVPVTWSSSSHEADVDILLSLDDGSTYPITLASDETDDGSYIYTPTSDHLSATAKIKVVSSDDETVFDESDTFKIATTEATGSPGNWQNRFRDLMIEAGFEVSK